MKDFDDKDLVIFAATIICVASMFLLTDAKDVVLTVISGLFGVAVGKATSPP